MFSLIQQSWYSLTGEYKIYLLVATCLRISNEGTWSKNHRTASSVLTLEQTFDFSCLNKNNFYTIFYALFFLKWVMKNYILCMLFFRMGVYRKKNNKNYLKIQIENSNKKDHPISWSSDIFPKRTWKEMFQQSH